MNQKVATYLLSTLRSLLRGAASQNGLIVLGILPALAQPVPPVPVELPVTTDTGCLIQSDFGSGPHKNFETVVLQGSDLVHYWHDNTHVNFTWVRGQIITRNATGAGCIIQSDFRGGGHGNFEVVVPEGRALSTTGMTIQRGQLRPRRRERVRRQSC